VVVFDGGVFAEDPATLQLGADELSWRCSSTPWSWSSTCRRCKPAG
jgi:hypothetical protein